MKNIHIECSYNIWDITKMFNTITLESHILYGSYEADKVLNRSYKGMYLEWYLHNVGYYLTLPFIKNEKIREFNRRFEHIDLEEHK